MTRLLKEYMGEFGTFFQKEAAKSMSKFDEAYVTNGVVRWKTNDRVPPKDLLELWKYGSKPFDYEESIRVSDIEIQQSIAEYKQFRAKHGYSDEERAEMKAAFGNEPVVDVLTGKRVI